MDRVKPLLRMDGQGEAITKCLPQTIPMRGSTCDPLHLRTSALFAQLSHRETTAGDLEFCCLPPCGWDPEDRRFAIS